MVDLSKGMQLYSSQILTLEEKGGGDLLASAECHFFHLPFPILFPEKLLLLLLLLGDSATALSDAPPLLFSSPE